MKNTVEFKVYGRYALFTDPITKIGGEKCSYHIPTYQALRGILESVYWKPTFIWYIDKVRVMKKIRTQRKNILSPDYMTGKKDLSIYNYLEEVEYQVQAHFEWDMRRPDLEQDRNENKHFFIAKRMIERGGRRDVYLGTRECQGYAEPCRFGEGPGDYDGYGTISYGTMFFGFDYPSDTGENALYTKLWQPDMVNGVITFPAPNDASIKRQKVKNMPYKIIQTSGTNEPGLLDGYKAEDNT